MPLENENQDLLKEGEQQQVEGEQQQQQEGEAGKQEASPPERTELELQAIAQGWVPKEEWTGKPEDHRSAKEFVDRGELLGKIRSQSTQLNELKGMIQHLSEHNKKVYSAGYEKALAELKRDRATAIKEGEVELVEALDAQIDEHKEAIRELKQPQQVTQQGPSEVTRAWLSRNTWYNNDPVMRGAANQLAYDFGRVNPGVSESDVYAFLDREIKKAFPGKFQTAAQRAAPSPEGGSTRTTGSGKGQAKSPNSEFEALIAEFDEFDAQVAKNLVRSGAITKEKYVEDYKKLGGR